MSERLRWAVSALSQPAEAQLKLFPPFAAAADELVLNFEEGYLEFGEDILTISVEQATKLQALYDLIIGISGPEHLEFWDNDSLAKFPEWEDIRQAAKSVLDAFGWRADDPSPLGDVYIGSAGAE